MGKHDHIVGRSGAGANAAISLSRRGLLKGLDLASPIASIVHHDALVVVVAIDTRNR